MHISYRHECPEAVVSQSEFELLMDALLELRKCKVDAMITVNADFTAAGLEYFTDRDFGIDTIDAMLRVLREA